MPSPICSALINCRCDLVSLWSICISQQRVHLISSGRYKLAHPHGLNCSFVMLNIWVLSSCPKPDFLSMVWNLLCVFRHTVTRLLTLLASHQPGEKFQHSDGMDEVVVTLSGNRARRPFFTCARRASVSIACCGGAWLCSRKRGYRACKENRM
jgi:hypothetical protein